MIALIMAGGSGSRLWPVSRAAKPKQFHRLTSNHSLVQETLRRIRPIVPAEKTFITTNESFLPELQFQLMDLPADHFTIEPAKRDNAAALGLALQKLIASGCDMDEAVVMLPSDHVIMDAENFRHTLLAAERFLEKHPRELVTIGIRPTYAETGYGYIKMNMADRLSDTPKGVGTYRVERFTEKPKKEIAEEFLRNPSYLWNAGIFVWRLGTIWALYEKFLPEMAKKLAKIGAAMGTPKEASVLAKTYPTLEAISIDYAIIEKTKHLAVIPGSFGWSDIGHWYALMDILPRDAHGNLVQGKHIGVDTTNSYIHTDGKLVATIGLDEVVVIVSGDAILVSHAHRVQDVKKVVDTLKERGMEEYL